MNIKIGIIGYGKMGKIRHNAIKQVALGEVFAISDPDISVKGMMNLSHTEIINNPDIDAIFICTPNYLNKKFTIKLFGITNITN